MVRRSIVFTGMIKLKRKHKIREREKVLEDNFTVDKGDE